MSSFRDLKNASDRDSKIVRDFASSDICVSLGLSKNSYYVLTSFGKGMSFTFHLLARALTVERTVIGRPPSQQGWINERAYRAQAQGPMSSGGPWARASV